MPLYKQVLLTNLKSPPKDVARVFQDCASIITSQGGVIRSTENRGGEARRTFSTPRTSEKRHSFKQYVPEWKRDALFEPDVPMHLQDKIK
ncbi:unnamed protein product [Peronospora destructor]|uniref:Ribosomal protein S10 domain-containing protein n=1 Tax=Peronospora destructor TaxID=86335 RepID=A0AAV0VEI8_9STRA|nr:unnamed protein product [Peronospora destructor]